MKSYFCYAFRMQINVEEVLAAARELKDAMNALHFDAPVAYTYNPLDYAWAGHEAYTRRYGATTKRVLFLGMNPGPFGMAQTGVPFGEVAAVTNWLHIREEVGAPAACHPKRPVQGFDCPRSEVSGRRLWGLFEELYGTAEDFFRECFVVNYCPLIWMSESGANITPAQLPAEQVQQVDADCRKHLKRLIELMQPEVLVGVGGYALKQLEAVAAMLPERKFVFGTLLHPSPASPMANRCWPDKPREQLKGLGIPG